MNLKFTFFFLLKFFYFILIFFLFQCGSKKNTYQGKVYVKEDTSGFVLYKDNKPFLIKGAAGFTFFKELKESGGNTLRTYDTTNLLAVLDSAHKYGLSVMVGLPLLKSKFREEFYDDSEQKEKQYKQFKNIVERFKDHPALLVWCLGNEVNFSFSPFYWKFYNHFNSLIAMIKETDRDHPVTTTLMIPFQAITLKLRVKGLDFVSFNIFGKVNSFQNSFNNYNWYWDGPYLISEWGANGYWETLEKTVWDAPIENTSTKKAEIYKERYLVISKLITEPKKRCLGSLVFYWGEKQEKTHTWFSMFGDNGKRTDPVNTLSQLWSGKQRWPDGPSLESMFLDYKGAKDNIFLTTRSQHVAEIYLRSGDSKSYQFQWDIFPEEIIVKHNRKKLLDPVRGLIFENNKHQITFKTPEKEGAYRLFVKVLDSEGNCSTANTPFYVLEKE